jgi:hypothetical protein
VRIFGGLRQQLPTAAIFTLPDVRTRDESRPTFLLSTASTAARSGPVRPALGAGRPTPMRCHRASCICSESVRQAHDGAGNPAHQVAAEVRRFQVQFRSRSNSKASQLNNRFEDYWEARRPAA